MINGGRLVILVGQSGSGKTTQMRELVNEAGFRQSPNITTRDSRPTDLLNEYLYASPQEYDRLLRKSGRVLWDIVTGNGARYAKDSCDIIEALTDPEHLYVNALVPSTANILVRKYGSELIRTVMLPNPGDDILLTRMTNRGDSTSGARERLVNENAEGWLAQSLAIDGLYTVTAQDVAGRHKEIMDFALS
jgi:guanylate kinase